VSDNLGTLGLALGDDDLIEAVSAHVERYLGPIATVMHEPVSQTVHVDLYWVAPTREKPFHAFATSGMAERAMSIPDGNTPPLFAELCTMLPLGWPIPDPRSVIHKAGAPGVWWPLNILKLLARYPHELQTALGVGHTIALTDGTGSVSSGVRFSGAMMLPGDTLAKGFGTLRHQGREIDFLSVFPLYPEELEFKLEHGLDAFLSVLGKTELPVPDLWKPDRPNALGGQTGVAASKSPSAPKKMKKWFWPF